MTWHDPAEERAYHRYSDWLKWKREIERKHGWIKQKVTRGQRGWERYRRMIAVLREIPLADLEANANNQYFDFKPLTGDEEGIYSMRYNQEIRLWFEFKLDEWGREAVQITYYGYHP